MPTVNEYIESRLRFAVDRTKYLPRAEKQFKIGSNCSIDWDGVFIGNNVVIEDNVVIRGRVAVGNGCLIKSGAVIGSKGFSFGFMEDLTPVAIGHTGGVIIGNNVEIGALTTVCQGTIEDTVVGDYVKIDDHVHIAHNCNIGARSCIAAGTKFGGGVVVGEKVWIGLSATIMNKVRIGDYALVGVGANVIRDVSPGDVVIGNPAKVLKNRNGYEQNL